MKEKKEESKKEEAKHEDKPGGRHFVPSYSRLWKREGEGSKDDAGVEKKPEEKKEEKKKPADPDISFNIPGLAGVQIKPGEFNHH